MKNHVGNYYNWPATVASNDTSTKTTRYDNAPDSICPAGWRLPIGRDSSNTAASREWGTLLAGEGIIANPIGDFQNYSTGGLNKIRTAPLWIARSGSVGSGSLSNAGFSGNYWSSTVVSSSNAFQLSFYSGYVSPASDNGRGVGYSVRCLAE